MPHNSRYATVLTLCIATLMGCSSDDAGNAADPAASIYSFANGCFAIQNASQATYLSSAGNGYEFSASELGAAAPLFLKPSALGRYLLYDDNGGYVVSDGNIIGRETNLMSDIKAVDDSFVSEAEWELRVNSQDPTRFALRHFKSGRFLTGDRLTDTASDAAPLSIVAHTGCREFPEEKTHSEGSVEHAHFDDGTLFGFVDAHSHIFASFGFGGGGLVHGLPYHPLGVEHALLDCARFHGDGGRKDLLGIGFDAGSGLSIDDLIEIVAQGQIAEFNHNTDGYPTFTTWPSAPFSSTHQTQYYKWIERAYQSGLRLVVQHAVSNQIICDFLIGGGIQPGRYSCNDMVGVDRQIEETYRMQDYIDAHEGGPGEGWFRVVTTPEQAREVIGAGKMAVVLGIEVPNLFNCNLTAPPELPACTEEDVTERVDDYFDRGIRVLFPVHKYDNAFSAGDGSKSIIELGNILQTGHFSNFTTDCIDINTTFDRGRMQFPGMNEPRENYLAPAPNDFSEFSLDPLGELAPFLDRFLEPRIPGEDNHCQVAGMTQLGEHLVSEIMRKGMILELDHFPRKSYRRAFEMIEANDYPATGTHGLDNDGKLYALGGVSTAGFGRCQSRDETATMDNGFQNRLERIIDNDGYPGLGFGFDLNGFAGAPGPRFGERSRCDSPQTKPVTYPFKSFAGDVTFTEPSVGDRTLDFNTEGMAHIGLVAELIEDVRHDGVTDEELEPLFRSAEAYIRMWEKAERRRTE